MESRKQYEILTESIVRDSEGILVPITKEEVNQLNFDRVDYTIGFLEKMGKEGQDKILIAFNYDDDQREIHEIPEVKEYVIKMYEKHSNLFFFLPKDIMPIGGILACLAGETQKIAGGTQLSFSKSAIMLLDGEIKEYANGIGIDRPSLILDLFN